MDVLELLRRFSLDCILGARFGLNKWHRSLSELKEGRRGQCLRPEVKLEEHGLVLFFLWVDILPSGHTPSVCDSDGDLSNTGERINWPLLPGAFSWLGCHQAEVVH